MKRRSLLIGIVAAAAFAGTAVVSAQTDWMANLADPGNPIWQQMPSNGPTNAQPQSGSRANLNNGNAGGYPDMPVTFRQVIWLIAQYDRFVVQPMRDQIDRLQQQVNGLSSSASSSSYGSCGIHQIGDTYAAPDRCNICTCTTQGQICTERACAHSSSSFGYPNPNPNPFSSASSCPTFLGGSCFAPIGCSYPSPVIRNGCMISCGPLDCGFASSFGFQTSSESSASSVCPVLNCPMIPAGCTAVPDTINGCSVDCGTIKCGGSSSSAMSACNVVADCAAPPPGCYYKQTTSDWNSCPRTCGTLVCTYNTYNQSSSASSPSQGKCATYSYNGAQDTQCAVCGDGVCSPYERCVPSDCTNGGCTGDCGGLYCPQDCG